MMKIRLMQFPHFLRKYGVWLVMWSGAIPSAAGWTALPPAGDQPLLRYAGFAPVPFTRTWIRENETIDLLRNRVLRWSRLTGYGEIPPMLTVLERRFGDPAAVVERQLPNGITWGEMEWRLPSGSRLLLRGRPDAPGDFGEIVLIAGEDAGVPVALVPQPVMAGACRAAVIATMCRCAGIDIPAPLAAAAWQGGEANGLTPLLQSRGFQYRMVETARDRAVNRRTLQWISGYNRRAAAAGAALILIGDHGGGRFSWDEACGSADAAIASSLPVPDPAGRDRFRQEIRRSLAAGIPVGWTLRRRTHGPRHRRLIVGYDEDTDRVIALDAFPPFTPRFQPMGAVWVQTVMRQTLVRSCAVRP